MLLTITNAGITELTQSGQPNIQITSFAVSYSGGVAAQVTDTALSGTIYHTDSPNNIQILSASEIVYNCVMDVDIGTFNFDQIGLFTSTGTLFAIGLLPAPQYKSSLVGKENVVNIDAIVQFTNIASKIQYTVYNSASARLIQIPHVASLVSPLVSPSNAYLTSDIDDGGNAIYAFRTNDYKWSLPTHSVLRFSGIVAGAGSTTTSVVATVAPVGLGSASPAGKYILQFTSGNLAGICRIITGISGATLSWIDILGQVPDANASFDLYVSNVNYLAQIAANSNAAPTIFGVNSNRNFTAADARTVFVATGTWTGTFDPCASLGVGWYIEIVNNGTGYITLDPNTTETINDFTTIVIRPDETFKVYCDGSNLMAFVTNNAVNRQSTNLASAASINLDAISGEYVVVTGNVTISTIILAQGMNKKALFSTGAGTCTLTGGSTLLVPGPSVNNSWAVNNGDVVEFTGEAGGVVRITNWMVAANFPGTGSGSGQVTARKIVSGTSYTLETALYASFFMSATGNVTITAPLSANMTPSGAWYVDLAIDSIGNRTLTLTNSVSVSFNRVYGFNFDSAPNAVYRIWFVARDITIIDVSIERLS